MTHTLMNKKMALVAILVSLVAVAGCSDDGTSPQVDDGNGNGNGGGDSVSYVDDIQPIWNSNCAGCHGTNGGLDLSRAGSRSNLVGITSQNYAPRIRVVAGDPEGSVLYLKLIGDASVGPKMPQGGSLSASQIELVRQWIADGAPDN